MGDLSRIGVSIDSELLRRFDSFIADKGYENRSEASTRITQSSFPPCMRISTTRVAWKSSYFAASREACNG